MSRPRFPEPAKPGADLTPEKIAQCARMPGGKTFLKGQRLQMQRMRAAYIEHTQQQLAEVDALLRALDLAIDGRIQA